MRRRNQNSMLKRFLLNTHFQFLFLFLLIKISIYRRLSPPFFCVYWCQSCLVCSELACETYCGGGPSTYVYVVVNYQVISANVLVVCLHPVTLWLPTLNSPWNISGYDLVLLVRVCLIYEQVIHLELHLQYYSLYIVMV